MIHLPELIQDLGLILGVAAVVTLIFKKLKQPLVLGYLVAGFLVSSHFPFIPTVTDPTTISVWAEIGVIFLLFGLGLEFSFKKLARVGGSASIIALVEVCFMLGLGYLSGQLLGWSKMDSLFLGGILSISSTTIIVRAFEELGLKSRRFVGLVFGVLIVEDLFAILLLVLLSTVAATQSLAGAELFISALRLGFFLILWFVIGVYLLPMILGRIRPLLNDETILVVAIGLCLLMVILATKLGFSPALGAFVMGSLLAETKEGKRVEHLILPVRDLFAAVFFVSVGMLIDPGVLAQYWPLILTISAVTIVGKFVSTALGAILSGNSLKHSVQSGMSLAQIGEFSFIIATLGLTLKVTSGFIYPIAVAVSAVTTFTTPYLIRAADPVSEWLEKNLPVGFLRRLEHYRVALSRRSGEDSGVKIFWRAYGPKVFLNFILVIAVTLGAQYYLLPFMRTTFEDSPWAFGLSGGLALLMASPFLWAVVLGAPAKSMDTSGVSRRHLGRLQFGFAFARALLGLFLLGFMVDRFVSVEAASLVILIIFALLTLMFFRFAEPVYRRLEKRFLNNLDDKEAALAPWEATLAPFVVSSSSELVGQSLLSSSLKERFGVSVAMIERGSKKILAPGRDDIFLPLDRVFLIGEEDQLRAVAPLIETVETESDQDRADYGLSSYYVSPQSRYLGKNIRECGLREDVQGLIVGLERNGARHLNPDSGMVLAAGDLLWIVGDRAKIQQLKVK